MLESATSTDAQETKETARTFALYYYVHDFHQQKFKSLSALRVGPGSALQQFTLLPAWKFEIVKTIQKCKVSLR